MNALIAAVAFCQKDLDLTKNLLKWIASLGGCPGHACLLFPDSLVPKEEQKAVRELAKPSFSYTGSIPIVVPEKGFAPNHMFMMAAQQIMFSYKLPFLWLEPDCVPLKSGWLSRLSEEYAGSPKKLLGNLIEATQPGLPAVHLAGVAIYPPDIFPLYDSFASIKSANVAWDMEAASAAVPRAKNSEFMAHFWGKRDLPPTFVAEKFAGATYSENTLPLSFIKPEAVLWHRCKDSSLIDLLKKNMPNPVYLPEPKKRGRPRKIIPATNQHD
jgi:hypothetical protein